MTATDDLHSLTGAYVLDAVPLGEQDRFERHLEQCLECQDEIREMREAVITLAGAAAQAPRPGMRERALAGISAGYGRPPALARRPQHRIRIAAAAAAVLLLAVSGLTARDWFTHPPANQPGQQGIQLVRMAPDARLGRAVTAAGGTITTVVSRRQGKIVVSVRDLPVLDSSRSYQVWLIGAGDPVPAGLLHPGEHTLLADIPADVILAAITMEPAGGSAGPTAPVIVQVGLD